MNNPDLYEAKGKGIQTDDEGIQTNDEGFQTDDEGIQTDDEGIQTDDEGKEELKSVLSLQHQLLMEAKTLNSDLDLAFQLQMQEAVTASLSVPDSSTSLDATVSPPPETDFDYVTLMLEDIARYEMERRDMEESEEAMKKFKNDMNRSIHDQNFARYIMNVPEEEWRDYGDYYERPFDGNVDEARHEGFRVYVKGLVSEERMREMKVMVGGVGVAIYDFWNNLVLEVRKKLEGAEFMSGEMAGVEAVIHGLNAALSLDLKRVTLFVDDFMVHQYITGRVQPGQSKMGTKVNEVALLQKRFTYFQPSLVARNDMKSAVALARDAIVSQITWPAESSYGKDLKETCVICFEDVNATQMFSVDGCFHRYCFSCMKQHVEVKLLNATEASCPHEGCNSEVTIDSCGKFLDPKLVQIMSNRKKEASVPVSEKVYCAFPRCSALMSKSEVLQYTSTVILGAEQSGARKCVKCHHFFCFNCKVPWHYNMTCFDYKRENPYPEKEDEMFNSLANKKRWRECIKCKNVVELAEGCYHITCRCGYEFCYTCGAPWQNKKPTCNCPIWDERNIIHGQRRMA
ncbi:pentatricopeptide repeat-containing protein [Hibiscus syriacus]|uniref:RBR-type E3 ubiquitin transferase n=1 Tax=Hibiscus syriacus TaxID=106335 RepID=A0A6A2ZN38_HIBSY|nr:uncharacterized protein LOC120142050 [Hibiscus syriacus]KAE8692966.1 pentatricopeptide repeat-containing protein [Hibiscus syriacus]